VVTNPALLHLTPPTISGDILFWLLLTVPLNLDTSSVTPETLKT